MKTALLFYSENFLGGAERRLLRVYREISNSEFQCDVIVIGCNKFRFQEILKKADCEVDTFYRLYAFEKKSKCIEHLLFKSSYDVIHFIDTSSFNMLVAWLCKMKHTKILYSICSYYIAKQLTTINVIKQTKRLLTLADHVDLLYPSSYEVIKEMAKHEVTVTPGTFTDLTLFVPTHKKKTIIFAAARLEEGKNPFLVLLATNIIKDFLREKKYHIRVLGHGYEEEKLREYIDANNLSDIVDMLGYMHTSEVLPSAEVFLSLQKIENYPSQALAEAIACGCYVIVTNVGDSERCANKSFADFIEDNPTQLANAIQKYIEKNKKEKEEIVQLARNYAVMNYDITKSKQYFKGLLNNLLCGGK